MYASVCVCMYASVCVCMYASVCVYASLGHCVYVGGREGVRHGGGLRVLILVYPGNDKVPSGRALGIPKLQRGATLQFFTQGYDGFGIAEIYRFSRCRGGTFIIN
eukprot:GHVO01015258.1.p1 GENE.GHVO01015258.1~~GHVO01015258.1.p1  ORF type:complete len:105 (-),score=13.02 GHVO01015258.1:65-379(-)